MADPIEILHVRDQVNILLVLLRTTDVDLLRRHVIDEMPVERLLDEDTTVFIEALDVLVTARRSLTALHRRARAQIEGGGEACPPPSGTG